MATRHMIDRLSERTEALIARLQPPCRTFMITVHTHPSQVDAEITAYREKHRVTDNDMLLVIQIVPYKQFPGETAAEAGKREEQEMREEQERRARGLPPRRWD
jgi:hypothetical protein